MKFKLFASKKLIGLGGVVPILLIIGGLLLNTPVFAGVGNECDTYGCTDQPYPKTGIKAIKGDVSIAGDHAVTNNTDSWFEVTQVGAGNITIEIRYECSSAGSLGFDIYAKTVAVGAAPTKISPASTAHICDGKLGSSGSVTSSSFNIPSYSLHEGYNAAYIDVAANGAGGRDGHLPFNIIVHGGSAAPWISYAADTLPGISGAGSQWDPQTFHFGLWMNDIDFKFQTPCEIRSQTVYIKWSGADANANYQPEGMYWQLDDLTAGGAPIKVESNDTSLGLYGDSNVKSFGFTVDPGHQYRWSWHNVSGNNEVALAVPFSQNLYGQGDCSPPKGTLQMCVGGDTKAYKVTGYDTGHASSQVRFRIIHDNASGGGTTVSVGDDGNPTSTNKGGTTADSSGRHTFTMERTYKLQILDLDLQDWRTVDTFNLTATNTQCSGPSSGEQDPTCTKFEWSMAAHSNYRYTVIPSTTQGFAASSSPAAGATSSPNQGSWRTLTVNGSATSGAKQVFDDNSTDNNQTTSFNYPAPTSPDWIVYIERWQHYDSNGNGTLDRWRYSQTGLATNDGGTSCYSASCTIRFDANLTGTSSGVKAGSSVTVHASITNTGKQSLPESIGGSHLALTNSGNFPNTTLFPLSLVGTGLDPGETFADEPIQAFDLTAPGSMGNYNLSVYPDYYGRFGIGASCNTTVKVYEHFNIDPSVGFGSTDWENPTTISYNTNGQKTEGPDVSATATSWLTREGTTVDTHTATHTYGTAGDTYTYNPTSINAGDDYCAFINISPAKGWKGADGDIVQGEASQKQSGCPSVVNEPYAHFFGSDVSAGGGFGGNCQNTAGTIHTYLKDVNQARGSGSQFASYALGIIEGFGSANLRGTTPRWPTGLSFSNTQNINSNIPAAGTGGYIGNYNSCLPDYFSTKPLSTATAAGSSVAAGANGATYYGASAAPLTLSGGGIGDGVNQAIYVEGRDVYINGNIAFANTGSWSTIAQMPSFYLIVKGGNIYIDPSVTQLDGVFVAQPNGNAGGQINTCAGSTGGVAASQIYNTCKRQLTVNGAFAAQRIFLHRSYSSLRYSKAGEYPTNGSPFASCGNDGKDVPAGSSPGPDCAAEVFNFSPELYLSQPSIKPSNGSTTGRYDYVTSLSPVL